MKEHINEGADLTQGLAIGSHCSNCTVNNFHLENGKFRKQQEQQQRQNLFKLLINIS